MTRLLLCAGATLALCACATPSETSPSVSSVAMPGETVSTAAPVEVAEADPNANVCKRMIVMGSNIPKRVCYTRAEWDAQEAAAKIVAEDVDRARRSATTAGSFE